MNLDDYDTPPGYIDAMENAVLDASAALRALRTAPPVDSFMFGGSFDEWRDVEFDAAGDPINPPTFELSTDEPVLMRAFEAMLAEVAIAPRTDHVTEVFSACIEQLHRSWIAHRRVDVTGHKADDGCRLCQVVTVAADVAFTETFDYASCSTYATEDAA